MKELTLKDTVEGMLSGDYKQRLTAEIAQNRIRMQGAFETIKKYKMGTLKIKLTEEDVKDLEVQYSIMVELDKVLTKRALKQGIEAVLVEGDLRQEIELACLNEDKHSALRALSVKIYNALQPRFKGNEYISLAKFKDDVFDVINDGYKALLDEISNTLPNNRSEDAFEVFENIWYYFRSAAFYYDGKYHAEKMDIKVNEDGCTRTFMDSPLFADLEEDEECKE